MHTAILHFQYGTDIIVASNCMVIFLEYKCWQLRLYTNQSLHILVYIQDALFPLRCRILMAAIGYADPVVNHALVLCCRPKGA